MNYHQRVKQERMMASLRRLKPDLASLQLAEVAPFKARCLCPLYEHAPHYQAMARDESKCPLLLYGDLMRLWLLKEIKITFEFAELLEVCKCD